MLRMVCWMVGMVGCGGGFLIFFFLFCCGEVVGLEEGVGDYCYECVLM